MKTAERKTLKVYDTITKKMVDVEVSKEVYEAYKRSVWREEKGNSSFYEHEIQFSMLAGGSNNAYENFHEFRNGESSSDNDTVKNAYIRIMLKAIEQLPKKDRMLIWLLYFNDMSERDCSKLFGINCKNIHKKKALVLDKINKLMTK